MSWVEVGDNAARNSKNSHDCKKYATLKASWQTAQRLGCCSDSWNHFKSPVHMTAANTQHCPYLTGLWLDWAHFFKMSALPVHVDGWTPFLKSFDQFPFKTPWSSSQLIFKKKKKKKKGTGTVSSQSILESCQCSNSDSLIATPVNCSHDDSASLQKVCVGIWITPQQVFIVSKLQLWARLLFMCWRFYFFSGDSSHTQSALTKAETIRLR